MENTPGSNKGSTPSKSIFSDSPDLQVESEKMISTNIMSITLSPDGITIKDGGGTPEHLQMQYTADKLPGVYCQGVQYYDLNGVQFINNTGMAILIDILKSLLEMGVEVQFVNVSEKIKTKIKEAGLEKIINCGEKQALEKRILL
jgi:ABC-type transporter Mla MlaB component